MGHGRPKFKVCWAPLVCISVFDELEWLRARFEQTYLISGCKIHSTAGYHDKDKCLTPETGLIQDCYGLNIFYLLLSVHTFTHEHILVQALGLERKTVIALNIVEVRSIAMPQRITLGQFCSGTAPLFLLQR